MVPTQLLSPFQAGTPFVVHGANLAWFHTHLANNFSPQRAHDPSLFCHLAVCATLEGIHEAPNPPRRHVSRSRRRGHTSTGPSLRTVAGSLRVWNTDHTKTVPVQCQYGTRTTLAPTAQSFSSTILWATSWAAGISSRFIVCCKDRSSASAM